MAGETETVLAAAGQDGASADVQSKDCEEQVLVGRRVLVAGKRATIRWGPGELQAPPAKRPQPAPESTEGTEPPAAAPTVQVVGIEYDDAGHGKHNGSHQGVQLFTCKDGHGSFVKLEKVALGVSIQYAIAEKYFADALPDPALKGLRQETFDSFSYIDSKGREKSKDVEFVGRAHIEQRQKRLEGFVEASFSETPLESRYPEDVWANDWSMPNLRSLWLDRTLLAEWAEVIAIWELCPQLEWLSLAKDRLAPLTSDAPLPPPRNAPVNPLHARIAMQPFSSKLRTIILNETMVSWTDLIRLDALGHFPVLEHLHLAQNNLQEGVPAVLANSTGQERRAFPRLRTLGLDGNEIGDWGVLQRAVAAFPRLETLHLNNNNLGETLEGLAAAASDQSPRFLTSLSLSGNSLSSWAAIGALAGYALLELRSQRNPITEGEGAIASPQLLRQVLIALMPTLLRLNSSEVAVKERTAAERYFLSLVQQNSPIVTALGESYSIAGHIERLRGIHGEVITGAVSEEAQATRNALVHSLVSVTLRPIGAAILDQPAVTKRLPQTMQVADVKKLAGSIFKKVPLDRIKLSLADPALPFGVPFDEDSRELGFYGVNDGAEVRVDDLADFKGDKDVARVERCAERMQMAGGGAV